MGKADSKPMTDKAKKADRAKKGAALKRARENKGFTQPGLGDLLSPKVDKQQIYKWENGLLRIKPPEAEKLAKILGIDPKIITPIEFLPAPSKPSRSRAPQQANVTISENYSVEQAVDALTAVLNAFPSARAEADDIVARWLSTLRAVKSRGNNSPAPSRKGKVV